MRPYFKSFQYFYSKVIHVHSVCRQSQHAYFVCVLAGSVDVRWYLGETPARIRDLERLWYVPDRGTHMWRLHVQRTHSGSHHAQLLRHRVWVFFSTCLTVRLLYIMASHCTLFCLVLSIFPYYPFVPDYEKVAASRNKLWYNVLLNLILLSSYWQIQSLMHLFDVYLTWM